MHRIIEVSQRLGDERKISPTKTQLRYHAQIQNLPMYWGCGNTPKMAIEDLTTHHPEMFALADYEIVDVEKQFR